MKKLEWTLAGWNWTILLTPTNPLCLSPLPCPVLGECFNPFLWSPAAWLACRCFSTPMSSAICGFSASCWPWPLTWFNILAISAICSWFRILEWPSAPPTVEYKDLSELANFCTYQGNQEKLELFLEKTSVPHIRAQGYKTFFMLNSAENEICSAYKKLNTSTLNFLPAQQKWAWNFSC